jgi:hypothetical protein
VEGWSSERIGYVWNRRCFLGLSRGINIEEIAGQDVQLLCGPGAINIEM